MNINRLRTGGTDDHPLDPSLNLQKVGAPQSCASFYFTFENSSEDRVTGEGEKNSRTLHGTCSTILQESTTWVHVLQ